MLSIFETGDDSYRLVDQRDVDVGWVRGSALGFGGFATEREALDAAAAASEALAGFLDRLTGGSQPEGEGTTGGRLRVERDGDAEWVVRGKRRLARLRRDGAAPGSLTLEFTLPSYVRPGAAVSASQVAYRAIGARAALAAPADALPPRAPAGAAGDAVLLAPPTGGGAGQGAATAR